MKRPTCHFCGKTLAQFTRHRSRRVERPNILTGETEVAVVVEDVPVPGVYGYRGCNFFCTRFCGFRYAVRLLDQETARRARA